MLGKGAWCFCLRLYVNYGKNEENYGFLFCGIDLCFALHYSICKHSTHGMSAEERAVFMTKEEEMIRLFRSINAAMMDYMNHLCASYHLTGVQCLIMMELQNKERTVSELAQRMMMKTSNVSSIVKRMETHGLVVRKRSVQDERSVYVCLREDAKKLLQSVMEENIVNSLFQGLQQEQITEILHALHLLETCIRRCEYE